MSTDYALNRSDLLNVKGKIVMAKKGHSLLKKKRDGLIMEFFKLYKGSLKLREELTQIFISAQSSLNYTNIVESKINLDVHSKIAKKTNLIDFQKKNLMGLNLAQIKSYFKKKELFERNLSIYSGYNIQKTMEEYEKLLEKVILVAEVETTLLKLIDEIEKTKRRVNGLEFNTVPDLESIEKKIKLALEEQEKDNIIRLKKIKTKILA